VALFLGDLQHMSATEWRAPSKEARRAPPLNTPKSAARCAPSSTRTSIRMSTNGKRTAFSRPRSLQLGDAGLLGINKPTDYGGMGLDYSYAMVMAEELGHINCGSVPMAIGVQTDMATPALARYGSDELRKELCALNCR
jgi:alkylation response protein AidB-like acyl-CoA dehydrogenase